MAITDIDISETLEAGAPSIKYTGDMNPKIQEPNMQVASDPSWEAEWDDAYENYKAKQIQLGQEFVDKETFMMDYQNNMASGGRAHFGLGSIFKSVGKAAKKFVKSPIGKAALLGLGGYYLGGGNLFGAQRTGMGGFSWGNMPGAGSLFGKAATGGGAMPWNMTPGKMWQPGSEGLLGKLGLSKGYGGGLTALGYGAGAVGLGMGAQAFENMQPDDIKALRNNPEALRAYLKEYHSNTNPDKSEEEVDLWVEQNMYSTGGRVGFADRGTIKDMTISDSQRDPKNMTTLEIISIIKGGKSTPEMFEELRLRGIEGVDEIALAEGQGDVGYSFDERLVDEYNPKTGTAEESFLMNLRESNPDVYGKYVRPKNYPEAGPSTMNKNYGEQNFYAEPTWMKAEGGRIGFAYGPDQTAQAAGIMGQLPVRNNGAGVKELDLRDSGGFIPPVGVKEKADDIPAMLSNNEFVMTADAVRAAGGGSVEKGAQVMYDQMKNLENKVA